MSTTSTTHPPTTKRGASDGMAAARAAREAMFASEEERRAFYSEIGKKGRGSQTILKFSEQDREALAAAYALLGRIAMRAKIDLSAIDHPHDNQADL